MRGIVMWMAAGAVLLLGSGAAMPLQAQCMACVSSSACGESAKRGSCSAQCMGTICACSDNTCQPTMTAIPAFAESPAQFASFEGSDEEQSATLDVLVRYCDGQVEWHVYAADGMRLIESRLLSPPSTPPAPARLAQADVGSS